MTLRVFGPAPRPTGSSIRGGKPGSGGAFLAGRAAKARAARTVPEIRALRARLRDMVRGERVERHALPPLLASVYHLVPRGSARRYRAAVRSAWSALAPVRVTVSGPWAPYAFAPEDLA
jgi:hypothetical protein